MLHCSQTLLFFQHLRGLTHLKCMTFLYLKWSPGQLCFPTNSFQQFAVPQGSHTPRVSEGGSIPNHMDYLEHKRCSLHLNSFKIFSVPKHLNYPCVGNVLKHPCKLSIYIFLKHLNYPNIFSVSTHAHCHGIWRVSISGLSQNHFPYQHQDYFSACSVPNTELDRFILIWYARASSPLQYPETYVLCRHQ